MSLETKTNLNPETVEKLQTLIQMNVDSRDGFEDAAENCDDSVIARIFRERAAERSQQAMELKQLVGANLEEPKDSGTISGSLHRAWMDIRAAFGAGTASMLAEAERGEDYIKGAYDEAVKDLPGSAVSDVLHRHYAAVKLSHDGIRDLRDSYPQTS